MAFTSVNHGRRSILWKRRQYEHYQHSQESYYYGVLYPERDSKIKQKKTGATRPRGKTSFPNKFRNGRVLIKFLVLQFDEEGKESARKSYMPLSTIGAPKPYMRDQDLYYLPTPAALCTSSKTAYVWEVWKGEEVPAKPGWLAGPTLLSSFFPYLPSKDKHSKEVWIKNKLLSDEMGFSWAQKIRPFFPTPLSLGPYYSINSFTCHQYGCLPYLILASSSLTLRCFGVTQFFLLHFPHSYASWSYLVLAPPFMMDSTSAPSGYPEHFLPTRYFWL